MPLSMGEIFAGFRVLRLLGSGGMGEVYLAQHPRLPRHDALKVLPADVSADPDYRARFIREADLASKLYHPNIVGVHDRGEHEGQLWISMDYVDGVDAGRLLTERYQAGMPVGQVKRIVTALAGALDYAHKQGLLHRDVKPANIMLTHVDDDKAEPRILLTDFGIARNVDDISGLTATNFTVGTVAYSAPEQLMGKDLDGRADQYALAATAYQLLTGSQLFPHSNRAVVISHHLTANPPALADTHPELAALDPVLAVALAKDPGDRFPRCADFARALAEQADAPGPGFASAPTEPAPAAGKGAGGTSPSRTPAERSRPPHGWVTAAAVSAAIALIGVVVLVWHPWQQQRPATSAPTTPVESPPAPPPPVAAPTSAAPAPTQVITAVAVVNGQPANGYREVPSKDNFNNVFDCDTSPAAIDSGIYPLRTLGCPRRRLLAVHIGNCAVWR
jgi:serine/threonine protein kinase